MVGDLVQVRVAEASQRKGCSSRIRRMGGGRQAEC